MKMSFAIVIGGAIFIFFAVVMAAVFIPGWVWNPPQTIAAHEYTDQQLLGRKIYWSNGCDYCHTQYVRYYDADYTGPVSQGGNYVYDMPPLLGSERTGPDLSYIGRKRDMAWEIEHLKFPRKYSPRSIMPNFYFMSESDLNALGAYLFELGDRTAGEWMIRPPVDYTHDVDPIAYPLIVPASGNNPPPQGWDSWSKAGLQNGKLLYIDRCQTCHGCAGNGLGTYAGTKQVTPVNYKVDPFRSMPDDQWFWHVSEGVPGTVMPSWKESLSEEDRWYAIRYIQNEFADPVERDPDEGDPSGQYANLKNPLPNTVDTLEQGKHTYIRECMVCHDDSGHGAGPYAAELRPQPANFSDLQKYKDYTDSDYFWRISEGLPWSAMPAWRLRYNDNDRWALVAYLRVNFTQTTPRPPTPGPQQYPSIFLAQQKPVNEDANQVDVQGNPQIVYKAPDPELGKDIFVGNCAHCHGLDGLGDGWDGQYLDVKPANFTTSDVKGLSDGDWFSRVSYGLQDSAMPSWIEWMPEQDRWDALSYVQKYITSAKTDGQATIMGSLWQANGGKVSTRYVTLSQSDWTDEGGTVDPKAGQDLYNQYCAVCHGGGKGQGLDPKKLPAGLTWPAPMPDGLPQNYVYQLIWEGAPQSMMPSFRPLLQPQDVWNLVGFISGVQQGQ